MTRTTDLSKAYEYYDHLLLLLSSFINMVNIVVLIDLRTNSYQHHMQDLR